MTVWDVLFLILAIVIVAGVALYFFNKWASRKVVEQERMINQAKQSASIYVIDKKKTRIEANTFPKMIYEQLPKWNRMMKMPLVKAKVGPQIATLMCDKQVFEILPVKKTVQVELAGIYIVSMKGMKTGSGKAKKEEDKTPWYKNLKFFSK